MLIEITPSQLIYLKFLEAHKIKKEAKEYLTQNQAFKRFGRSNVERWIEKRKVKPHKRVRTIEYKLEELLRAAEEVQDYAR